MAPRSARKQFGELDKIQHSSAFRANYRSLEGADGELTKIVFESGPDLLRAGLFFSTGCHQASDLSKDLGLQTRNDRGSVVIDPDTEESSVTHAYSYAPAAYAPRCLFRHRSAIRGRREGGCYDQQQAALLRRDGFRLLVQPFASLLARSKQRRTPRTLISRRIAFWITRDDLFSNQPPGDRCVNRLRSW